MRMTTLRQYLFPVIITVFLFVLTSYVYFQAHDFILGPVLTISSPINGSSTTEELVVVEGTALNISNITLNDRSIVTNESGQFREQLLLAYGYNIITIEARDRFNRVVKETIELVHN